MCERKIKQSIQIVALALLLCGYYLTPSSAISYKFKNVESKIEVLPRDIDNRIQQGETLHKGLWFNETENFKLQRENPDSTSQSPVLPWNLFIF